MNYQDKYFISSVEALKLAQNENYSDNGKLQICYYEGEKIESDLVNLVHLPLDNFVELLGKGTYRLPQKISFNGFYVEDKERKIMEEYFSQALANAKAERQKYNTDNFIKLRTAKLDFSEKLRFYIPANNSTKVMQHMSRNIAEALVSLGYEVLLDIFYGCEDNGCLKNIAEFNPHATIHINHLSDLPLNDDVFHFVWVQDLFGIESFKKQKKLREKDFVFHLTYGHSYYLGELGINSMYQPFCIDNNIYKKREIPKEKKIVFIGSSYKNAYDNVKHEKKEYICEQVFLKYLKEGFIDNDKKGKLIIQYNISDLDFGHIINYIERDLSLKYISELDLEYELEIYGIGWDEYPEMKMNYKGILSYGEDISKIYNSATYGLVIGGYIMQQRTLESSASGTIPLVFDSSKNRDKDENIKLYESVQLFKRLDDLPSLLGNKLTFDLEYIVNENSYEKFANRMNTIIKDSIVKLK